MCSRDRGTAPAGRGTVGRPVTQYGYVVHVAAGESSADAGRITVLWMRGTTLAPRNAVVTCEGSDDIARYTIPF